jgi:hypothetical protein
MSNIMSVNAMSDESMSIYELAVDKISCAKISDDEMSVYKNDILPSRHMKKCLYYWPRVT